MQRLAHGLLMLAACSDPERAPTAAVAPPAPADDCVITVELTAETLKLSGGPTKAREVARDAPDLAHLASVADHCAANIRAPAATRHGDVVLVMEQLADVGIREVWLGAHAKPPPPPPNRYRPPPVTTSPEPSGELRPAPPRIQIASGEVMLDQRPIGTIGGAFRGALVAALPAKPTDPTIIVSAKRDVLFGTVDEAVAAAYEAGYTRVVLEVPQ